MPRSKIKLLIFNDKSGDGLFLFSVITAPIQFYLFPKPLHWLSLSMLTAFCLLPAIALILYRQLKKINFFTIVLMELFLFGLLQIICLVHSPNPASGMGGLLFLAQFVILLVYCVENGKRLWPLLYRGLPLFLFAFCIETLMILFFRFDPVLEANFWRSDISSFLINHYRDVSSSNLTDPLRGGGFLECAQSAGILMLAGLICVFSVCYFHPSKYWILLWLFFCAGLAATGTKFTILLLFGWLFCGFFIRKLRVNCIIGVLTLICIIAGIMIIPQKIDLSDKPGTMKSQLCGQNRMNLWKIAIHTIAEAPVRGSGYGGWEQNYYRLRGEWAAEFQERNPNPHNIYLLYWLRSGFLGFLLLIAGLPATILAILIKAMSADRNARIEILCWGSWIFSLFAIGMIEDIPFWGRTEHIVPLTSIAWARCCWLYLNSENNIDENAKA